MFLDILAELPGFFQDGKSDGIALQVLHHFIDHGLDIGYVLCP